MRDVAEAAVSTVSAFINDSAPVGRLAGQRIREGIVSLGYSPNPVARSLARGSLDREEIIHVIRSGPDGAMRGEAYRSESDACAAAAFRAGEQGESITARHR